MQYLKDNFGVQVSIAAVATCVLPASAGLDTRRAKALDRPSTKAAEPTATATRVRQGPRHADHSTAGDPVIPAIGLVVGIVLGVLLQPTVPIWMQPYLPIAVVAALDAVFGGLRALLDGIFDDKVFVVSFLSNVFVAAFIVYLGDQLGVGSQLSTGVVVVLGHPDLLQRGRDPAAPVPRMTDPSPVRAVRAEPQPTPEPAPRAAAARRAGAAKPARTGGAGCAPRCTRAPRAARRWPPCWSPRWASRWWRRSTSATTSG